MEQLNNDTTDTRGKIPVEKIAGMSEFAQNICHWWNIVYTPGHCVELRTISPASSAITCGYYDSPKPFCEAIAALNGKVHCYTTINPVPMDMMARYPNQQYGNWKAVRETRACNPQECGRVTTTSDSNILEETLFCLDIDAIRPKGVSAKTSEMQDAMQVGRMYQSLFLENGIDCVMGMSGNGCYVLVRTPTRTFDEDAILERKELLHFLREMNEYPDVVDVDQAVFNPSRILKVLGTRSMKGANSEALGRIHRDSYLCDKRSLELTGDIYEWFRSVSAHETPKSISIPKASPSTPASPIGKSAVDRSRKYIAKLSPAIEGEGGSDNMYQAAAILVEGFSLSSDEALPLLREYNERCLPPFSETELLHKLSSAIDRIDPERLGSKLRDGRALTSAANGKLGGRQPLDYGEVTQEVVDSLESQDIHVVIYQGRWYKYDGHSYREMSKNAFTKLIVDEIVKTGRIASRNMISNMEGYLISKYLIADNLTAPCFLDSMDNASEWMPTKGSVVNVRAVAQGETEDVVRESTPNLFSLFSTDYVYNPEAKCPMWERYLEGVQPIEADREILQMMAGLCLVEDTSYNVFFILYGSAGTGKSVFGSILSALVGKDNTSSVPLSSFGGQFDLWPLVENRLNYVGDMQTSEYGKSGNVEGILKQITAGEDIEVQRKFEKKRTQRSTARCVFATNHLPYFNDKSQGLWDRVRIISFDQRFRYTESDNPHLANDIMENEMSGVMNWAIEGLGRLLTLKRFPEHSDGQVCKTKHQLECDVEEMFMVDAVEITQDSDNHVSSTLLYSKYREWCDTNGYRAKGEVKFVQAMLRHKGVLKVRTRICGKHTTVYSGVKTLNIE